MIDGALDIKARIVHGLVRRCQGKLNAGVQVLGVTLAKVLVAVKTLDLGRHLNGKRIGIEVRDRADAARAGAHCRPGGKRGVTERRYGTDAGDCNSLFHHVSSFKPFFGSGFYIAIPPSTRTTSPVM